MRKFMFYNRFFIINSHPIGNGRNSKQVAPPELREIWNGAGLQTECSYGAANSLKVSKISRSVISYTLIYR